MRTSTSVAPFSSGEPSPLLTHSHPVSIQDEDSLHDHYGYTTHDEENWGDEDELSESETTISYTGVPPAPRSHPARLPLRTQPLPHQQQYRPARRVPEPAPSVEHQDEYGPYGQGYTGGQFGRGGYPRSGHQHPQAYGAYYGQGQMVGYNGNPFSPVSSSSSNAGYYGDMRGYGNEMAQYPAHYYHQQHYAQAAQQYHMGHPPMHIDAPAAPAPPAPPAPSAREKELQEKLAAFEKEKEKQEQAERAKEIEAESRRKVEEETKRYEEKMQKLKEENKREIERAKQEAERAAVAKIENERKAAEERAKQQEAAVRQAEERVRIQFEQQLKAAEARRKKEEEERAQAEEAAKLRLEAALRADAEMKKEAAKKAAEQAEKLKQIQEEAKRKADAEFAAKIQAEKDAAAKKAEEDALAKAEREAFKKKVEEETRANLEEKAKKDRGPYLQFKDALGRKYSFPYRLCTTWPNMEELIKQAFDNVEELAYQVHEGWYDLVGPSGEIILPSVWEKVIEPEWSITMSMWPLDRIQRAGRVPPALAAAMAARGVRPGMPMPPPMGPAMGRGRGGMPTGGIPAGMAPPDGWAQAHPHTKHASNIPPGIQVVRDEGGKKDKKKKQPPPAFVGFFGGKPPKKKSSSKK
ncbi:hypothetical protein PWT90_00651 [Aphanocladium album]|nr:hypothetical protein PWT90_00651 [Aphanocladium album]